MFCCVLDIFVKSIFYLSISIFVMFKYAMLNPLSYVRHYFANLLTFDAKVGNLLRVLCNLKILSFFKDVW